LKKNKKALYLPELHASGKQMKDIEQEIGTRNAKA